jgi:hypothetical protein
VLARSESTPSILRPPQPLHICELLLFMEILIKSASSSSVALSEVHNKNLITCSAESPERPAREHLSDVHPDREASLFAPCTRLSILCMPTPAFFAPRGGSGVHLQCYRTEDIRALNHQIALPDLRIPAKHKRLPIKSIPFAFSYSCVRKVPTKKSYESAANKFIRSRSKKEPFLEATNISRM